MTTKTAVEQTELGAEEESDPNLVPLQGPGAPAMLVSLKDSVTMALSLVRSAAPGATVVVMACKPDGEHYIAWANATGYLDSIGLVAMGQSMVIRDSIAAIAAASAPKPAR